MDKVVREGLKEEEESIIKELKLAHGLVQYRWTDFRRN